MLKPVTKKYTDESDMEQFRFTFYCDYCGRGVASTPIEYVSGFRKKIMLTKSEKTARMYMYARAHDAAYERANNESRLNFDKCEICGIMVCGDCSTYMAEVKGGSFCCPGCAAQIREENT